MGRRKRSRSDPWGEDFEDYTDAGIAFRDGYRTGYAQNQHRKRETGPFVAGFVSGVLAVMIIQAGTVARFLKGDQKSPERKIWAETVKEDE